VLFVVKLRNINEVWAWPISSRIVSSRLVGSRHAAPTFQLKFEPVLASNYMCTDKSRLVTNFEFV